MTPRNDHRGHPAADCRGSHRRRPRSDHPKTTNHLYEVSGSRWESLRVEYGMRPGHPRTTRRDPNRCPGLAHRASTIPDLSGNGRSTNRSHASQVDPRKTRYGDDHRWDGCHRCHGSPRTRYGDDHPSDGCHRCHGSPRTRCEDGHWMVCYHRYCGSPRTRYGDDHQGAVCHRYHGNRRTRCEDGLHHGPRRPAIQNHFGRSTRGRNGPQGGDRADHRYARDHPTSWVGHQSHANGSDHRIRCPRDARRSGCRNARLFCHHRNGTSSTTVRHHGRHQTRRSCRHGTIRRGRPSSPAGHRGHARHDRSRRRVGRRFHEPHGRCRPRVGHRGRNSYGCRLRRVDRLDRDHQSRRRHRMPIARTRCCRLRTVLGNPKTRCRDAFRCCYDQILRTLVVRFAPVRPDRHHHCCSRRHPASLILLQQQTPLG